MCKIPAENIKLCCSWSLSKFSTFQITWFLRNERVLSEFRYRILHYFFSIIKKLKNQSVRANFILTMQATSIKDTKKPREHLNKKLLNRKLRCHQEQCKINFQQFIRHVFFLFLPNENELAQFFTLVALPGLAHLPLVQLCNKLFFFDTSSFFL